MGYKIDRAGGPVADKIRFLNAFPKRDSLNCDRLVRQPSVVPQLTDSDELVNGFQAKAGVTYAGTALNDIGRDPYANTYHRSRLKSIKPKRQLICATYSRSATSTVPLQSKERA